MMRTHMTRLQSLRLTQAGPQAGHLYLSRQKHCAKPTYQSLATYGLTNMVKSIVEAIEAISALPFTQVSQQMESFLASMILPNSSDCGLWQQLLLKTSNSER